jgi:hypothetical protein
MMVHPAEHDSIFSDSLNTVEGAIPTERHIPPTLATKRRKIIYLLAGCLIALIITGIVLGVVIAIRSSKLFAKASSTGSIDDPGIEQNLTVPTLIFSGGLRQLYNISYHR